MTGSKAATLLSDWTRSFSQVKLGKGLAFALSLVFLILVSYWAWQPLAARGYFPTHDDAPPIWLFEMDRCFQDGQFPCRWVPDMGHGYGYPLFNFQPPLAYYVGELVHLSGFSVLDSVKITFMIGFFIAGFLMFLLAREFWGNLGGIVAAAFYVYAPYHALDVYVRGALAEHWGMAFFPGIFWGIHKVVREGKLHHVLLLSLFIALLLLSHNLMTMILILPALLWALVLLWQTRSKERALPLLLSGMWGLGLAAFFTLPAIFELDLTKAEASTTGYFDYHRHFVDLNQLFVSRFWGFGTSEPGPNDGMSFQIGWLHWGIAAVTAFAAPFLWRKHRVAFWGAVTVFAAFGLSVFMMTDQSLFIWEAITRLKWLQFPWRFLAVAIFTCSFLAGFLFALLQNRTLLSVAISLALVGGVIVANQEFFRVRDRSFITDEQAFSGENWVKLTGHTFDFAPIYSREQPPGPAPAKVQVIEGDAVISRTRQRSDSLAFAALVQGVDAKIRASIVDFPNWRVKVDGRTIPHDHRNNLGLITFDLPVGSHQVSLELGNTGIRTAANYLSILSWALFFFGWVLWLAGERWRRVLPRPGQPRPRP